ncbi:MAG: hypothetical protein HY908_11830 [Myxococcales bacterium]|nr:hypothetical protein [Myxococcales bacterium]
MDEAQTGGTVELELEEGLYPLEAVYGAAYVFIDRCYVHLDRAAPGRLRVRLRPKAPDADSAAFAGEFENELLGQAWRVQIAQNHRALFEAIASRAVTGAAGPPGLDELFDMDIGADTAFEDPLGLAMSWEEKYKKKAPTEPATAGEPAAAAAAPAEPPAEPPAEQGGAPEPEGEK